MFARPTLATLLVAASALPAFAADENTVRFTRDVKPLLTERCFHCHGPDEKTVEAGLRLDTREHATAKLESGNRAVVPGKPDESALLERVTSDDAFTRMPPADAGEPLTRAEIDVLRRWIAAGADYERHWSFVAPQRPVPPQVRHADRVRNPIDRFVLHRLEAEGLDPAPEADRRLLIRRLSLALTGLPPSVDEVERFVDDDRPDAVERLVDRLLADPGYGERWGRVWLDLARYADSAGYAQDPPRTIWMYRDWVVDALNANQPFDQFTIEQLAGDLLPDPRHDQLLATAFHRNTMTNSEGGTNDEEFRNAAVVDRVNTTMQVWMGITMGCAQCHSHKYDPISQEEYFRFFAILNNTADADRGNEAPNLYTLTAEQQQQRERLQERIAQLEAKIAKEKTSPDSPDGTVPEQGPLQTRYVRVELPGQNVFLHLAEVQVFADGENVAPDGTAKQISTDYDGEAKRAVDGNTNGDYFAANSTSHTAKGNDPWWEVDLGSARSVEKVVVWNRTDGGTAARLHDFRVVALDAKRRPLWVRTVAKPPQPSVELKLPATAQELSDQQRKAIAGYGKTATESDAGKTLAKLKKQLAGIKGVPTPIMQELPPEKRRTTRIQIRGNYKVTEDVVTPGVPDAFHDLPPQVEQPDRLDLARWLVSPDNPLTARVVVNRYWEQLFGKGLVETSEDFGNQGEPPSHPELLDWLATELVRSGWDTKHLVKLIVTSATYRQSSRVGSELREVDPDNRLLARGPSFRLPAEMIRDQALAAGGLLSRKMAGPSVRPPRPNLGLRAAFGGSTDWKPSPGLDRYRRGLYTTWRRTTPYPSFMTFDATSREVCTIRRSRTNTPLQALTTLNDPVYVEAAQSLARLIVREGGDDTASRAGYAFRRCLSRNPTERELARLVDLFQKTQARYADDPQAARKLATNPLGPVPEGTAPADLAAWTVVGNVLMNLDEFLAPK